MGFDNIIYNIWEITLMINADEIKLLYVTVSPHPHSA